MKKISIALLLFLTSIPPQVAQAVSVADYGQLPAIRSAAISPNGRYLAYIRGTDEGDFFVITDLQERKMIGGARAGSFKARSVLFATNEHVIFRASKTSHSIRVRGAWESNGAVVYSLKTKKMRTLMRGIDNLYPAQSGLGKIVGIVPEDELALMPAYIGSGNKPNYSLLKVNLNSGKGKTLERGNNDTIDWFVNQQGKVVAREDFRGKHSEYRVLSKTSGKWVPIYESDTDRPDLAIVGLTPDGESLIYTAYDDDNSALFHMSLTDGEVSGPFYEEADRDVEQLLLDGNRIFEGVQYSGLLPQYDYVDPLMNDYLAAVQRLYPGSAIAPVSSNANHSRIVFRVSGPDAARDYLLYDAETSKLSSIGSAYPNVERADIGDVRAIRYRARDELPINAVVTWPVGIEKDARKALPLLVFPHGGPESYDSIQFDWWAQYFARRGYVVMQPNFRGSTGSGVEFRDAGRGKWGAEMQHDISDGVAAMVEAGYADPQRVCIMGASYGGYAALAGGAFTPELYRCIIAVAGVSDLPRMLSDTERSSGRYHWVVSYWNEVIGDADVEREKLERISPINFAGQYQAPVLLLHGKDDTVVPIRQSTIMAKALKKANKPVEMVSLRGEDHWLSTSDTRLEMLEKIDAFLSVHNPPGQVSP